MYTPNLQTYYTQPKQYHFKSINLVKNFTIVTRDNGKEGLGTSKNNTIKYTHKEQKLKRFAYFLLYQKEKSEI